MFALTARASVHSIIDCVNENLRYQSLGLVFEEALATGTHWVKTIAPTRQLGIKMDTFMHDTIC